MSKYTTQVRFICETAAGMDESEGFNNVDSIIETAAPHVFNFDFPIWDEAYRPVLEKKILRHYYTREICAETVGLWKLWLSDKLNMIMPYYNKLYESTLLQFNPFYDVDVTTEHTGEGESASTGSNTESGTSNGGGTITDSGSTVGGNEWVLFSDTPQGGIEGVQNASIIQDSSLADYAYLTTAQNNISNVTGQGSNTRTRNTIDTSSRQGSSSGTVASTDEYVDRVFGKRGHHTYSGMLLEFRKTIVNIDAMVIEELKDLFFGLWD